jgi:RNA polymerase sigma-70 factor (ECF subfamily)
MAAVRDPITGTAPPPVIRGEASAVARRDAGREAAALYRRHAATVYRYAWHMLGDREDAEDATQAAFLSVHAALADGTVVREPQAWVLRIARNECLARIEARMRRPLTASLDDVVGEVSTPAPSVPRAVELRSDLAAAGDALGRLPAAQREAYVMREWLGLSTAEVAVSLGTTAIAVDGLLGRARRELVRVLGAAEESGAAGCRRTCEALAAGAVDRAARAHLVRCRACRSVRRALRPKLAAGRALMPPAALAERLGDTMPGFGAGGALAGSAAGGGGLAAMGAKLASGPAALKGAAAALTAVAAVGGGVAIDHTVVKAPPHAHVVAVSGGSVKAKPAATKQAPRPIAPATRPGDDMRGDGVSVTPARPTRAAAAGGTVTAKHRTRHRTTAPVPATTTRRHRSGSTSGGGEHARGGTDGQSHRHRGSNSGPGTGGTDGGRGEAERAEDGHTGRSGGGSGHRDGSGSRERADGGSGGGDRQGGGGDGDSGD